MSYGGKIEATFEFGEKIKFSTKVLVGIRLFTILLCRVIVPVVCSQRCRTSTAFTYDTSLNWMIMSGGCEM